MGNVPWVSEMAMTSERPTSQWEVVWHPALILLRRTSSMSLAVETINNSKIPMIIPTILLPWMHRRFQTTPNRNPSFNLKIQALKGQVRQDPLKDFSSIMEEEVGLQTKANTLWPRKRPLPRTTSSNSSPLNHCPILEQLKIRFATSTWPCDTFKMLLPKEHTNCYQVCWFT